MIITEWGGILFSGIALIGASGMVINRFSIESLLLMFFVGVVMFAMLWVFFCKRKVHMFVASFFAAIYLIISYIYFNTSNYFFVVSYMLFSLGTMIYAVREIANENDN